eukprot:6226340-Lingulodinium_polyedra.AAC.1
MIIIAKARQASEQRARARAASPCAGRNAAACLPVSGGVNDTTGMTDTIGMNDTIVMNASFLLGAARVLLGCCSGAAWMLL